MFRTMTKPNGWVRALAGAAAFLAIAAVAVPAGAATTTGTGLSLTDLKVVSSSDSSSTVYSVTVTKLSNTDAATGVNLYFAPEREPKNHTDYQPMEIATQSCVPDAVVNPTVWHCQFTVDWKTGAAWYNSTEEYEPGMTVHQWYVDNFAGLLVIFAKEVGNSGKGFSAMSDMLPLIDIPPNNLPEVPYAFGLPVILIAGIGGAVVLGRRRRQQG